jgi:Caspase domain/WD domain, G-beta repeat
MFAREAWALALVGAGLLTGSLNAQEQPAKKRALLVGVKQYQHAALDALKYTENDAVELATVLRGAGFQVVLLCDSEGAKDVNKQPTKTNIDRELKAMLKGVGRDDVVLVGLAGHGLQPDGAAESHFRPADGNPSIERGDGTGPARARFPETLVSVRDILRDLDDSGAGRRFLLVDACPNDPGARGRGVADLLGYSDETGVLLSCSKGQRSFEPEELKHGLFFYYVIQGFKGGAKDPETNEVTWDDLCKYARRQVSRNVPKPIKDAGGSQTPQDFGSRTGEPFVLAKIRRGPGSPGTKGEYDLTSGYRYAHFGTDGVRVVLTGKNVDSFAARVYDLSAERPITLLTRDGWTIWRTTFSPDGTRVLTEGVDHTARVWNAETGEPLTRPLQHRNHVIHAVFSPDGTRVATASEDKTARVWDAKTGEPLTPPLKHEHWVQHAMFSPDGARVATASRDKTARVWDTKTGAAITPPLQHGDWVHSAIFSPDGARVVTASGDGTARIWDAKTGESVTRPLKHNDIVFSATFSPEGGLVVTACSNNSARVWEAKTGAALTPPLQHQDDLRFAAFSPDGTRVVTSGFREAHLWDAKTGQDLAKVKVSKD